MSSHSVATTTASNRENVDWRNYDYSEGPPRRKTTLATGATGGGGGAKPLSSSLSSSIALAPSSSSLSLSSSIRDTNPYSQRQDFPNARTSMTTFSSSSSSLQYSQSNNSSSNSNSNISTNNDDYDDISPPSKMHSRQRSFGGTGIATGTGTNIATSTTSSISPSAAAAIMASISTFTPSSPSKSTTLTYRPAKPKPQPVQTSDSNAEGDGQYNYDDKEDDEVNMMHIPKVKKYAENLSDVRHDSVDPFDEERAVTVTKGSLNLGMKKKSSIVTPTHNNNNHHHQHLRKKNSFDQVWEEAENDWKNSTRRVVSFDDEEEEDYDDNNNNNTNNNYNNNDYGDDVNDNRGAEGKLETVEFESFAGDRNNSSIASANDNDRSDDSDASVGKMNTDVPLSVAPVSILKNSGRFDSSTSSINGGGRRSSSSSAGMRGLKDDDNTKTTTTLPNGNGNENGNAASISDDHQSKSSQQKQGDENDNDNDNGDEDDDTLFEFSNEAAPKKKKKDKQRRNKGRYRSGQSNESNDDDDDDTSIDDYGNQSPKRRADTLKDRTKQAWSVRNKATAAATATATASSGRGRGTVGGGGKREKVSFRHDATVREFTPDSGEESASFDDESDDCTEYTDRTEVTDDDISTYYTERSMISSYSKSNGSEAEDMLRDFFFIGGGDSTAPGRRRYRKGRRQSYEDVEKDEQETFDSESTMNSTYEKKKEPNDDAVALLYQFCEGGLQAFNDVCGLFSISEKPALEDSDGTSTFGTSAESQQLSMDEWYSRASEILFYTKETQQSPDSLCSGGDPLCSPAVSLDDGKAALVGMSLTAARVKHDLKNLKYDDTQTMNPMLDIKFVISHIGIPIGIGFEETFSGCWVKKIFVNGNAANSSIGDKLEVGDHLASVNGICVYEKNINEICKILASTTDSDKLQMTFIRYIGPIRSSNANEQQGYEVIDPQVKKVGEKLAPVKLSKSLSSSGGGKQPVHKGNKAASKDDSDEKVAQTTSTKTEEVSVTHEAASVDVKKENIKRASKKASKQKEEQSKLETKKKKRGFNLFRRRKDNGPSKQDKENTK